MKKIIAFILAITITTIGFAQEKSASINPEIQPEVTNILSMFFTTMIGVAIALMVYMLYKVVVVEGNRDDEFDKRVLSFFVGLLLVIAMDVIADLQLSALIIESFTSTDTDEAQNYFSAGIITVISALLGIFMSWQVHLKMKDFFISRRLFVLISTVILFYMIRVYIVALDLDNLRPMIANLAFIIGYAIILIFTPKQLNPELEEDDYEDDNEATFHAAA